LLIVTFILKRGEKHVKICVGEKLRTIKSGVEIDPLLAKLAH